MSYLKKSVSIIQKFYDQKVEAKLDGTIFEHVPDTFLFHFKDPAFLTELLIDDYEDYLEDWNFNEVVPVASVSSKNAPSYLFAYIFLDWSNHTDDPEIVVTTTDDWDGDRKLDSIDELGLKII